MVIKTAGDVIYLMNWRFYSIYELPSAIRRIVIHDFMTLYYSVMRMQVCNDKDEFEVMKKLAESSVEEIDKLTLPKKKSGKKVLNFEELARIDDLEEQHRYIDECLSSKE